MLIFRRLYPTVFLIGMAVITVFIALAVLQFMQIRSELERERIAILADRIAAPFEAAASIGLPLSSVRNSDALLERARQLDPAINAVIVFGEEGKPVSSSGTSDVPFTLPRTYASATSPEEKTWSGETAERFFSGLAIFDAVGKRVGGIMVYYSVRESQTAAWSMIGQLLIGGVAFILLMGFVIWLFLRVTLPRQARDYDAIEAEILEFEEDSWRVGSHDTVPDTSNSGKLKAQIGCAEARYREAATGLKTSASPPESSVGGDMGNGMRAMQGRVVLAMTGILTVATILFSVLTINAFDRAIAPTLENRTQLIGELVRSEMQRALELGIPISALGGLTPYLESALQDFTEVSRISIEDGQGAVIAEAERPAGLGTQVSYGIGEAIGIRASQTELSVLVGTEFVGKIRIEGNPRFIEIRLRDVVLDVAVLAMALLFIGLEAALAVMAVSLWNPHARVLALTREQMQGRFEHIIPEAGPTTWRRLAARLNAHALDLGARMPATDLQADRGLPRLRLSEPGDMRLPLFLFAFGSEVTASFLPIFASAATRPEWLSAEFAAAAPLLLYLLGVAILSPFSGAFSHRFGAARIFKMSVPPVMIALVWMACSHDILQITLARGLIAIFFALATISAQEYALAAKNTGSTARVASAFTGLVLGGTFCGSVVGGVIASRFGFPIAILCGVVFVAGSGVAAHFLMRGPAGDPANRNMPATSPRRSPAGVWPFTGLFIGIAVPASAATAAIIWYFLPLVLSADGARPSDIARIVMLYYLAAILIGPFAGRLANGLGRTATLIVTGASLSALALFYLSTTREAWLIALAVALLGVGHALIRSPIFALASHFAGGARRPIHALRFLERTGAIIGLMAAASMKGVGATSTIPLLLSIIVAAGVTLFVLTTVPTLRGLAISEER